MGEPVAGYYACTRKNEHLALCYTSDKQHLEVLVGGDKILSSWAPGDHSFTIKTKSVRPLSFSVEKDCLVKSNGKKRTKYERVGIWPKDIDSDCFTDYSDMSTFLQNFRDTGCSVVSGAFKDNSLLEEIHTTFYTIATKPTHNRGWFSTHVDCYDANYKKLVDKLLAQISQHLDALLGAGKWVHDGRLQIGFVTNHRAARVPNWHVDSMFLNHGEPFSVLVGIPLHGAFEKPNSGHLAVFEKSHMLLNELLSKQGENIVDGPKDKAEKISKYCELKDWQPSFIKASVGDFYMCHYRMIHGVTHNFEMDRSIAYLRIKVIDKVREEKGAKLGFKWADSVKMYDPWLLYDF